MASPSYATDLNDIFLDGGGTSWALITGGRQSDPETDDFIQGSSCWSHDPFTGTEGGLYPSTETIASGDAVYVWIKCDVTATLATHAAGGMQVCIGSATTAYKAFYVRGSDDYQYGGWICVPVEPTMTPSTTVGSPTSTTSQFGARWYVPSSGATKGYPMKVDAMRHGRQIEVTAGDSGTPASWDALAAYDSANARQWGICQPTNTGAALQGLVYWGTGSAAVYSRESNRTVAIIDTEWTATDFTQILFPHASNDIVWDNVGLIALGTSNRGIINVSANGAITWTNSVFDGIDTTALLANCTFDGTKWLRTNAVTAGGASLLGSQILTPSVAADASGLIWNVATDTDGKLDDMTFSKGTNAHHAIQLGASSPSSVTLRGIAFTGFNASDGQNDSVLYLADKGSDTVWSITANGCTGTVSYKKARAGDTVTVTYDQVTITIEVRDKSGSLITDATEITLVKSSDLSVLKHAEDVTSGSTSYLYEYAGDVTCYVNVLSVDNYVPRTVEPVVLGDTDQTIVVQLEDERGRYYNPMLWGEWSVTYSNPAS